MKLKIFAVLLIAAASTSLTYSQTDSTEKVNAGTVRTKFFPVSELREGMRGTALTVFHGTEPEEFSVEILGVVPGAIGPKQDMIIGRLSGGGADRTAVFAGMSGSPVYIDGRLAGAISYSFPFSKEPICGITPIEQMIGIFQPESPVRAESRAPRSFSYSELAPSGQKLPFLEKTAGTGRFAGNVSPNSSVTAIVGQTFEPIAIPISFNGFSPLTLKVFENDLLAAGLLPISGTGGAAAIGPLEKSDENTLRGGDSVSMHLTRGDYSMAAAGTVTYRDGDQIYAFGHPFLSLGTSDLPMSESSVVAVVPSLNNSFKLAVSQAMVGTMTQDRATGVFGKLGQAPKMIPVSISLTTSRKQKRILNFEIAKDDILTPLLVNIGILNALIANERGMGDLTVEIDGEIKIRGQQSIVLKNRFSGIQASQLSSLSVALPVNSLFQSRFDGVEISGIDINLTSADGSKTAGLESISIDRSQVKAGESVRVQAYVRTDSGKVFIQNIPVQIPADTPAGKIVIAVGDGASIEENAASKQFAPRDLGELIETINKLKKGDRLYVQTFRLTNGAIIGASELPNLPPSVLATLNNKRTAGGFTPTLQTVLTEQELPPAEFLISGQQTLMIDVIR